MGDAATANAAAVAFWNANAGGGAAVSDCVSNVLANSDTLDANNAQDAADVQAACQATSSSAAGQAAQQATCPSGQIMTNAGCMTPAAASAAGATPVSSSSGINPTQVLNTFGQALTTGFNIFSLTQKKPVGKVATPVLGAASGPSATTLLVVGLGITAVVAAYVLTRPAPAQQPIYLPAPPPPAPVAAAPAPLAKNGRLPISRNRGRSKRNRAA